MNDFLKSTRFKILIAVMIVLLTFMLRAAYMGSLGTMASYVLGLVVTPLQQLSSNVSYAVSDAFDPLLRANDYKDENEALREEIRTLRQQLVDYEKVKKENEQYRQYLEMKEENKDFQFELAAVIGRSPDARFYSFTVDKGTVDGVALRDPVVTADGLVGYISEVGPTYSTVITILDPTLHVGASDARTRDTGIVIGTVSLSAEEKCKLSYIDRESAVARGDIIVTSGVGGVFPKGLMIGTVEEVQVESHGMSLYAVIEPVVEVPSVKDVIIITEFEGQTVEETPAEEEEADAQTEGDA